MIGDDVDIPNTAILREINAWNLRDAIINFKNCMSRNHWVTDVSMSAHILVVDDDPEIRSLLRRGLETEGYTVSEASSLSTLMRCLQTTPVNLITLDLGLGREDALKFAREIRTERNVPIIMITGRGQPEERAIGLEFGADDYIIKPFHIQEVRFRVHKVLERYGNFGTGAGAEAERFEFELGVLDTSKRELRGTDGALIKVTDLECELLAIFARHPKRVLSRDELMKLLNGRSWSPENRTLDGHVARLRKKIEPPDQERPSLIKSVRGVGYIFTGEVRQLPGI